MKNVAIDVDSTKFHEFVNSSTKEEMKVAKTTKSNKASQPDVEFILITSYHLLQNKMSKFVV